MSTDSLAMFRKHLGPDLGALAEQHVQHDLKQSDRDNLKSAASAVATHVSVGSAIGLGLGMLLAFRLRSNRTRMFNAFKASDRPVSVKLASGQEQPLPDVTPLLQPSFLGDITTYLLLGFGGLFVGGETGILTGTFRARSFVARDGESQKRIEAAFRNFQADALRTQANLLEQGAKEGRSLGAIPGEKWL